MNQLIEWSGGVPVDERTLPSQHLVSLVRDGLLKHRERQIERGEVAAGDGDDGATDERK